MTLHKSNGSSEAKDKLCEREQSKKGRYPKFVSPGWILNAVTRSIVCDHSDSIKGERTISDAGQFGPIRRLIAPWCEVIISYSIVGKTFDYLRGLFLEGALDYLLQIFNISTEAWGSSVFFILKLVVFLAIEVQIAHSLKLLGKWFRLDLKRASVKVDEVKDEAKNQSLRGDLKIRCAEIKELIDGKKKNCRG